MQFEFIMEPRIFVSLHFNMLFFYARYFVVVTFNTFHIDIQYLEMLGLKYAHVACILPALQQHTRHSMVHGHSPHRDLTYALHTCIFIYGLQHDVRRALKIHAPESIKPRPQRPRLPERPCLRRALYSRPS